MSKISRLRREGLGPPILCTPIEWAVGVFASFDKWMPGWRSLYDAEAIELGLVDLAGGNEALNLDPVRLDALAEILAAIKARNQKAMAALQETVARLSADLVVQQLVVQINIYFRMGVGSSSRNTELRALRADLLKKFIEIIEPAAKAVLERCADMLDLRERRAAQRHPLMTEPDQAEAAAGLPVPDEIREARDAGYSAFVSIEKELSPGAFRALRAFLAAKGTVSEFEASRSEGVSPATMTRALQALRWKATTVIDGADPNFRYAFMEGLCAAAVA